MNDILTLLTALGISPAQVPVTIGILFTLWRLNKTMSNLGVITKLHTLLITKLIPKDDMEEYASLLEELYKK